jgi:hypothetical protein
MQKRRGIGARVALVIRGLGLFAALSTACCGAEKSARDDVHTVLEAISRLDPNAPAETRRAAIEAVSALPIEDKEILELRDVCLQAHRGLLEAEVDQQAVRAALESPEPASQQLGVLQGKMQRAAAVLATAHAALTTCESRSRELTVRYR